MSDTLYHSCKALIAIETISIPLGSVYLTVSLHCTLVALRVFGLWDHRRHAMKILWSIFATTYGCFFVLIALLLRFILVNVSLPSGLPFCAIPRKSGLDPGAWISLLVFNILIILSTVSSAIERPYRHNKDVIDRLKRDGCISFLVSSS
ncbi:hypothetical protein BC629DRAFT_1547102 [Irpex lacteus]|nr:hypothetical protein BC629DRAFT_1547102 [Irpex lacteus]